ncbi:hypothetical protein OC845_005379 [Tilletia horrida]|nr:hypothetical protein OC845_005379 [Tilletia horrida]
MTANEMRPKGYSFMRLLHAGESPALSQAERFQAQIDEYLQQAGHLLASRSSSKNTLTVLQFFHNTEQEYLDPRRYQESVSEATKKLVRTAISEPAYILTMQRLAELARTGFFPGALADFDRVFGPDADSKPESASDPPPAQDDSNAQQEADFQRRRPQPGSVRADVQVYHDLNSSFSSITGMLPAKFTDKRNYGLYLGPGPISIRTTPATTLLGNCAPEIFEMAFRLTRFPPHPHPTFKADDAYKFASGLLASIPTTLALSTLFKVGLTVRPSPTGNSEAEVNVERSPSIRGFLEIDADAKPTYVRTVARRMASLQLMRRDGVHALLDLCSTEAGELVPDLAEMDSSRAQFIIARALSEKAEVGMTEATVKSILPQLEALVSNEISDPFSEFHSWARLSLRDYLRGAVDGMTNMLLQPERSGQREDAATKKWVTAVLPQLVHFVSSKVSDPSSASKPVTSFQLQVVAQAMARILGAHPKLSEEVLLREPICHAFLGKRFYSRHQAKKLRQWKPVRKEGRGNSVSSRQALHAVQVFNCIFEYTSRGTVEPFRSMVRPVLATYVAVFQNLHRSSRWSENEENGLIEAAKLLHSRINSTFDLTSMDRPTELHVKFVDPIEKTQDGRIDPGEGMDFGRNQTLLLKSARGEPGELELFQERLNAYRRHAHYLLASPALDESTLSHFSNGALAILQCFHAVEQFALLPIRSEPIVSEATQGFVRTAISEASYAQTIRRLAQLARRVTFPSALAEFDKIFGPDPDSKPAVAQMLVPPQKPNMAAMAPGASWMEAASSEETAPSFPGMIAAQVMEADQHSSLPADHVVYEDLYQFFAVIQWSFLGPVANWNTIGEHTVHNKPRPSPVETTSFKILIEVCGAEIIETAIRLTRYPPHGRPSLQAEGALLDATTLLASLPTGSALRILLKVGLPIPPTHFEEGCVPDDLSGPASIGSFLVDQLDVKPTYVRKMARRMGSFQLMRRDGVRSLLGLCATESGELVPDLAEMDPSQALSILARALSEQAEVGGTEALVDSMLSHFEALLSSSVSDPLHEPHPPPKRPLKVQLEDAFIAMTDIMTSHKGTKERENRAATTWIKAMLPQLVHFVSSTVSDSTTASKPATSFQLQAVVRAMVRISRAHPELTEEILLREPLYAIVRGKRYYSRHQAKKRRRSNAADGDDSVPKDGKPIVSPRQARHAARFVGCIFEHAPRDSQDDFGQVQVMFRTIMTHSVAFSEALRQAS